MRGVSGAGSYGTWNDAGWNWTLGVNFMAVVWGIEIFAPMLENHIPRSGLSRERLSAVARTYRFAGQRHTSPFWIDRTPSG
jgi:hypothetical protein